MAGPFINIAFSGTFHGFSASNCVALKVHQEKLNVKPLNYILILFSQN